MRSVFARSASRTRALPVRANDGHVVVLSLEERDLLVRDMLVRDLGFPPKSNVHRVHSEPVRPASATDDKGSAP